MDLRESLCFTALVCTAISVSSHAHSHAEPFVIGSMLIPLPEGLRMHPEIGAAAADEVGIYYFNGIHRDLPWEINLSAFRHSNHLATSSLILDHHWIDNHFYL